MAKTVYEAPEGTTLNKKTLEVTTYKGTVDLTADAFKDSGATAIDASKATNAITLKAGEKSTTITTGSQNATVIGGAKADKISLGSGSDLVSLTAGSAGNDVINNYGSGSGEDTISIANKHSSVASFVDKGSTVVLSFTDGTKDKFTINKSNATDAITFRFSNGGYNYGELPSSDSKFDNDTKKTGLTIGAGASGTVNLSKIASTVKNVGVASGNSSALNIVGNGQANAITLGAGGGTVDGGYAVDAKGNKKATADKLYGSASADTFVLSKATGGADQIFNYGEGDTIKVTDMTQAELVEALSNAKNLKDSGKNVVATFDKTKLTVDGTPKQIVFVGSDNKQVIYGPDLDDGISVDAKKSTLTISSETEVINTARVFSVNDTAFNSTTTKTGVTYVNANYAPKLKTIDASGYEGTVSLGSAAVTTPVELKSSKGGGTLVGGIGADVFEGGAGQDVFVYNFDSVKGGGKDKINDYGSFDDEDGNGDYIQINGFDASKHAVTLTEKKGKSVTIALTDTSTKKSLGQIEVAGNPSAMQVVVVDGNKNIIATNPATTPIGLEYDEKKGIATSDKYNGNYEEGVYLVGDKVNSDPDHTGDTATIKASDYSSKLAVINASTVDGAVTELLIEGNENAKNVLSAPNSTNLLTFNEETGTSSTSLSTTLKGGLLADTFNGSTLPGSKDTFYITPQSKADKDVINNYDEGDVILVEKTANVTSVANIGASLNANQFVKFDDKGADAVFTFDKTVVTVKDGAGKKITLGLVDGNKVTTTSLGHLLPTGLKYDAKKTTISVKETATVEAANVGGDSTELNLSYGSNTDSNGNPVTNNAGYIKLDLNNEQYFNTVKTVNLKKINAKVPTEDDPTKISDNAVHVTLLGNSLANDFWAGGNASSTTIFYGGRGDLNKPEADKFYGGVGKDIFVYTLGDGADAIGDKKEATSTYYAKNDVIVLGSGSSSAILDKSNLFITDSGSVVSIQIGTDTKKGKLTVLKDSTATPLKIVLTKDSNTAIAVASGISDGTINLDENPTGTNYALYNYGLSDDTIKSTLSTTKLDITGFQNITDEEGELLEGISFPQTVKIEAKDVSSTIKDITAANAGSEMTVHLIGNNNPNTLTLGKGGGTVNGSYSYDAKGKIKATADKYVGGAGADVFDYSVLKVEGSDVGGKDEIKNYSAEGIDAIYVNSLDQIKSFKYNDKTVAFTFDGKGNVLTVNGTDKGNVTSDTWITFIYNSGSKQYVKTYTGFDKKLTTKISDLTEVINPWNAYSVWDDLKKTGTVWTPGNTYDAKSQIKVWHYTGNTWTHNGLNFTVQNVADAYETYYNESLDSSAMDVSLKISGNRPTGVTVEEHGDVITVNNVVQGEGEHAQTVGVVNFGDFWFNSTTSVGRSGVHIKGLTPTFGEDGLYNGDEVLVGNKGTNTYRLADLDGIDSNGYELLKTNDNWQYTKSKDWQYSGDGSTFTISSGGKIFDVNADGSLAQVAFKAYKTTTDDTVITIGSGIASSMITFDKQTQVGKDGIHISGFDTNTTFALSTETTVGEGDATTATVLSTDYVLAELDGDSSNGLELLKTNDNWKLTPEGWIFTSDTTKFTVNLVAPTVKANTDGSADSITIGFKQSVNADGEFVTEGDDTTPIYDKSKGIFIDFTNANIKDKNVTFDGAIKTNANGVHVKGLSSKNYTNKNGDVYSSQVTVGDAAYWMIELDNDTTDAYKDYRELAKVNANWTPTFAAEKDSQSGWTYKGAVNFTLNAASYNSVGGDDETSANVILGIDDNGALKDVTVSGNTITVNRALASLTASGEGEDIKYVSALDINNFSFASTTSVGKNGIHIIGYDSDTTLTIKDKVTYQLVDLDGNAANGYELMKVGGSGEEGWTYENKVWSYSDENTSFLIEADAGLTPQDDGTPSGVSVSVATVKSSGTDPGPYTTTTISFDASVRDKVLANLTFINNIFDEGFHIVGLNADTTLKAYADDYDSEESEATPSYVYYQVAELDGNTKNGSEIMEVDREWTLKGGAWSFANNTTYVEEENLVDKDPDIEFSIAARASVGADSDGTPKEILFDDYEDEGVRYINLDLSEASKFLTTDLSFTKFSTSEDNKHYGANGLHIILPKSTIAGSPVADGKITIGGTEYQFVDLDEDEENYELMKVDGNWTLKGGAWSFANSNLEFSIAAGAEIAPTDNGTPNGISVDGTTITFGNDEIAIDEFDITKLTIGKATAGTGNNALRIIGLGVDKTIKIGSTNYQLVDLDGNADNGYELMQVDSNWSYSSAQYGEAATWSYSNSTTSKAATIAFEISNVNTETNAPTADGIPNGISVDTVTKTITLNTASYFNENNDIKLTTYPAASTGTSVLHIVAPELAEGTTIKDSNETNPVTYALFDADVNPSNGLELTYDGWLPLKSGGFKYNSNSANFTLQGSAFGAGNQPEGISVSGGDLVFANTNTFSTNRDEFHVLGVAADEDGNRELTLNGTTFELRDVDGKPANGFELTKDGWAKSSTTVFMQLDGAFTVKGSGMIADTDSNIVPDSITYTAAEGDAKQKITFANATATQHITLTGSANNWADNFDLVVTGAEANTKYYFEKISGKNYSIASSTTTTEQTETPQLPATGFDTTGFEVDDLINYDSAAAFDSGLDEIMEIKALAATDSFNVGSMFDAQSDLVSAAASTYSARNKLKK